ncbi:HIRAN domain-containing protein [Phenylobacterium sp.]|uniref:HIRAN domain-containing protein n=1 Tax=Phenylobacterium sp. TaxID=1871053 RepID=UPI0025D4AA03|nr:HIRAN domain-containing protein [Phenylobacterium sp.]MCA3740200.1 hypothetical protein [Phenylobacterium sp.]
MVVLYGIVALFFVALIVIVLNASPKSQMARPAAAGRASPTRTDPPEEDDDNDFDDDVMEYEPPPGVTRPDGEWEVFRNYQDIVGERYRMENSVAFLREIREAIQRAVAVEAPEMKFFGVRLRREPDNPHDPQAVAVDGFWLKDPKDQASAAHLHLGYLPANVAGLIAARLGPDAELGAELVGIEIDPDDDDDPVNVTIHVLNRPGANKRG